MEKEYSHKRYAIPKSQHVTIGVSRNVRNTIRLYAMNRNLTMAEATYLLIRIGLEFEMLRKELKHKEFLQLVATLLNKHRRKTNNE